MAFTLTWEDEAQTIMRVDIDGQWNWEQMHASLVEVRKQVSDKEQRLDMIICLHLHPVTPHDQTGQNVQRALREMPENPGIHVFVGGDSFAQTMNDLFSRMYGDAMGIQIMYANSLGEARKIIASERAEW